MKLKGISLKLEHGGRRSLVGLESVTLRPFPLTSALDPPAPTKESECMCVGEGGSRSDVRENGRRVTDSNPASDLLPHVASEKSE